jgi:hypothetical protein
MAANNHYAGFGPATANSFRKMVGLKELVWEEMKQERCNKIDKSGPGEVYCCEPSCAPIA